MTQKTIENIVGLIVVLIACTMLITLIHFAVKYW